ncbi:alpha/beta hydrolase [Fontivita pretiosa]|uniref:alpha/beta hydrolase n=1 Tax=Fontivita pretiosa TaxID=2989684 RepID=UPI003D17A807
MSEDFQALDPVTLWPDGAPGRLGDGPEDRPVLRPFVRRDVGAQALAAIIVLPGGGYAHRARHEADPVARWLNSLGVASFVLEYRVAPYRHPQPLNDARRAVRIVRHRAAEWGIDPRRVGVMGFSAGGHLAASAATWFDLGEPNDPDPIERQSSRPDLLIACYPVISLARYPHLGSYTNLLGEDPDERMVRMLSLETRVTDQTPPTFLWHTANDAGVPVENSLLFAAALARHRVPFSVHIFPEGRHGLGLADDQPVVGRWRELCADFLRSHKFC